MWGVVAAVFALTAFAKASDDTFLHYLADTQMFPLPLVNTVGRGVIVCEVLAALLLLWPRLRTWGWLLVAALSSCFAVFHIFAAVLGDLGPCRCLVIEISHDRLVSHLVMIALCSLLTLGAALAFSRRRLGSTATQRC